MKIPDFMKAYWKNQCTYRFHIHVDESLWNKIYRNDLRRIWNAAKHSATIVDFEELKNE